MFSQGLITIAEPSQLFFATNDDIMCVQVVLAALNFAECVEL